MNKSSSPQKERYNGREENGYMHMNISSSSVVNEEDGDKRRVEKKIGIRVIRYKECLKNHAAAIGGNAVDGCGEFMPSGEDGSIEALKCSACNCHRNFHRKETEGIPETRLLLGSPHQGYPTTNLILPSRPLLQPNTQMMFSYNTSSEPSESDEKEHEDHGGSVAFRAVVDDKKLTEKRFRTKFTEEQKAKMAKFAEKAGWRMQKLDESVVQQFCQEIGIKRRVLKVWMHNNKHKYVKENAINS